MSRLQNIQSMIGYGLPYVFVEKIKLTDAVLRGEDKSFFVDNHPLFVKNKFGKNKKQKKSELDNKDYFTDEVFESHLQLSVPELFLANRWFGKRTTEDMVVRVVQSTHPLATAALMNGGPYVDENLPSNVRPFVKEKVLSIPKTLGLAEYKTREVSELDDILCLVPLEVSFRVNSKHLTYFIYCESGDRMGRKTVEKVLDRGRPKVRTTCYYLPNDKMWSGPVHFHEGKGWMAGPVHTSRPHPTLERVIHNNTKIQDYRIFKQLSEIQGRINLSMSPVPKRMFSDLFLSRDSDGTARGLFVFDMFRALTLHSKFNSLLLLNESNNLMKRSRVQDLKIIRQKVEQKSHNDYDYVDQADAYDVVARSEGRAPGSPLTRGDYFIDEDMDGVVEKYVGSVGEKNLAGIGARRAFSFLDSAIKDFESGVYRYGVEIIMTDPTDEYLQLQLKKLKKAHQLLNDYYAIASNRKYYNRRGQLDYQGAKFLGSLYGSSNKIEKRNSFNSFPWRRAVKLYLHVIKELTGADVSRYAKRLYPILGPTSRTVEGVEAFMKLLEALMQKLSSYDTQSAGEYTARRSAASHNRSPETGLISVNYFFDKTYDAGLVRGYGLDYFGSHASNNYTGPVSVSATSLYDRFRVEAERSGVTVPSAQDLENFRKFYSSLGPMIVKTNVKDYFLNKSLVENPELTREIRARLLKARNNPNNQGVRTPDQGGNTYELLRSMLRQYGSGTTLQAFKIRGEDPCDPEVVKITPGEGESTSDSTSALPGGKDDNFTSKEQSRPSGKDQKTDDLEKDVPEEVLEDLVTEGKDVLLEEGVGIKYVTGFNENLEIEHVGGPFVSDMPYLVVLETTKEENQDDVLNEIIIIGDVDESPPKQEEPEQNSPADIEEPVKEEEIGDGGEDPSIDLGDNSEAVPESTHNIGAEELAPKTTGQPITRVPVVAAPPTTTATEQEQTYLVGMTTGGGTSGY